MDINFVRYLSKLALFKGLPEAIVAELAYDVQERSLAKDEVLFSKGSPGESLFIIRSGWVKIVTQDAAHDELVLNHCGPGEVIGEMALIDNSPRSASVVALAPTEVLELKREHFLETLHQQPTLALDVMRNITARLRFATTYIEKAIEWSQKIAQGDYSFAINEIKTTQDSIAVTQTQQPDEARADELLSAFFRLVEGVKAREEKLKQQLRELTIEIDEVKREKEVEDITKSDYFTRLKAESAELRRQRAEDKD